MDFVVITDMLYRRDDLVVDFTRPSATGSDRKHMSENDPAFGMKRRAGALDGDGANSAPPGHPGKGTRAARTQTGVQRKASGGMSGAREGVAASRAFAHEDPFGMHLIGDAVVESTAFEQGARTRAVQRQASSSSGAQGAEPGEGPEAGFLGQITAEGIIQTPRPLRLERGRPGTVNFLPTSAELLPADAAPVPLHCKLLRDSQSVDETTGQWQPGLAIGPLYTLTVPGPGIYRLELHVNAGRPGARVLSRRVDVAAANEETVASDEGSRLRAGANNDGKPSPPVETYRDMLAAVLAVQGLTDQGDDQSYERARQMLEPVNDRLREIYPKLLEKRGDYQMGRNAIDRRFGIARDEMMAWDRRLVMGSTINTADMVTKFQVAESEIKLGTGEVDEVSDLRSLDRAAKISAAVAAGGAAAIIVLPLLPAAGVAVASDVGAVIGARVATWAVANPQTALVVSEVVVGMGIQVADGGLDGFLNQVQSDEDLAWVVVQVLMDLAQARQGMHDDSGFGPPGGSRASRVPDGGDEAPVPTARTPRSKGDETGRTSGPPPIIDASEMVVPDGNGGFVFNRKKIEHYEKIVGQPESVVADHAAREAVAAEQAAAKRNIERVYVGKEADRFINGSQGDAKSVDAVAVTQRGTYYLYEAKGQDISKGLMQLEANAQSLGSGRIERMTLVVPERINTPGYSVSSGQLMLDGRPAMVDGKPVYVKFTNTN